MIVSVCLCNNFLVVHWHASLPLYLSGAVNEVEDTFYVTEKWDELSENDVTKKWVMTSFPTFYITSLPSLKSYILAVAYPRTITVMPIP